MGASHLPVWGGRVCPRLCIANLGNSGPVCSLPTLTCELAPARVMRLHGSHTSHMLGSIVSRVQALFASSPSDRESNECERRVLSLQPSEAAVISTAVIADKEHGGQARRVFVLRAAEQKQGVQLALSHAYRDWVGSLVEERGGQRSLPQGFESKLHWFLCTRALGLDLAYAPACAHEGYGRGPRPWLGGVEVYTSWKQGAAADVLACLAGAGLLAEAGEDEASASPPSAEKACAEAASAEAQLLGWLSASLLAFDARLALDDAVTRGLASRVKQLLGRQGGKGGTGGTAAVDEPLPSSPPNGDASLHVAAGCGHAAVVRLLLARGASVDAPSYDGSRPLHRAASKGSAEAAALLLAAGAAVDCGTTSTQQTPLHLAASNGRLGVAKLLVAHGAAVQLRTAGGDTPHNIASRCSEDVCCGGDAPGREYSGLLAFLETLHPMGREEQRTAARRSWDLLVASRLQDAALRADDAELQSPELHRLGALLRCFAPFVDALDYDGSTALHAVAEAGRAAPVALMLSRGANLHARNPFGDTALHLASASGAREITLLLVGCGAELRATNAAGGLAADVARSHGHDQLADLLDAALAQPAALLQMAAASKAAMGAVEQAVTWQGQAQEAAEELGVAAGVQACASRTIVRPQPRSAHDMLQRPLSLQSDASRPAEWKLTEYGGGNQATLLRVLQPNGSAPELPVVVPTHPQPASASAPAAGAAGGATQPRPEDDISNHEPLATNS